MGRKKENLVGMKFGRLTVESESNYKLNKNLTNWVCVCDCGLRIVTTSNNLKSGNTRSCGCITNKHGLSKTRLYNTWNHMIHRCYDVKDISYKRYGEKKIKVCDEWLNDFITFKEFALNNGYNDTLQIDRIDNDGNYEPNNVRFVTKQQNAWNRGSNNNSTSIYKGVSIRNLIKYHSSIVKDGKTYNLGTFDTEIDAAIAYDNKAKLLFGLYANLNFK